MRRRRRRSSDVTLYQGPGRLYSVSVSQLEILWTNGPMHRGVTTNENTNMSVLYLLGPILKVYDSRTGKTRDQDVY